MTFRQSLSVTIISLAVVPIICLSIICTIISGNTARKLGEQSLKELAKTSGLSFERHLSEQNREIALISKTKRLGVCLQLSANNDLSEEALAESNQVLADWVNSEKSYFSAYLVNESGVIVSSNNGEMLGTSISDSLVFQNAVKKEGVYYSDVVQSQVKPGSEVVFMSSALEYEGVKGVVVLEATLGFFNELVANVYMGETGASYIINDKGEVICHTDDSYQFISGIHPLVNSLLPDYRSGKREQNGNGIYDFQGSKKLMGYYILDNLGWVFITRQQLSEILMPVYRLQLSLGVVFIVALILAIILCMYILRKFMRPIQKLQNVFKMATETSQYISCNIDGDNEFSELASGYNEMIRKLNTSFEDLEQAYRQMTSAEDELQRNVDLLEEEKEKTTYIAMHDIVTGISNRSAFVLRMKTLFEEKAVGAMLFIDIDGFKGINDVFGHYIGDMCLVEIADRLTYSSCGLDLASRIGGDEFFLIKLGNKAEVQAVAEEVCGIFNEPLLINGLTIKLTASVGIAMFPKDGSNAEELMRNADVAMYHAKDLGRNRCSFYDVSMTAQVVRQMDILQVLREAIEKEEVYPVYQPEVQNDRICGFETLMRINSKELGSISPVEFVPLAESSGSIVILGKWILEKACKFTKELINSGKNIDFVSVNLSLVQLQSPDFVEMVLEVLSKTGLEPKCLQLEITETVLIKDPTENVQKLSELRKHGISIALDDFGTGFSSLNYLYMLPIDVLKIDKSFVDEIVTDDKKAYICKSIIELAHTLGMRVVAEGVEDSQQRDSLHSLGCDIYQGYLYSRPLTEKDLVEYIERAF